ncbi:MAG: radical SAM protein [Syntrophaceae bacterium]|nr:radical SAM protein [Syntrophaceae bacterium]
MSSIAPTQIDPEVHYSPEYVRLSLAAAMTLKFTKGWFYRNARLRCINLLLTYRDGCKANCAFCGLAGEKERIKSGGSFIRVPWKSFRTSDVIEAIKDTPEEVSRVCISMITHPQSIKDTIDICKEVVSKTEKMVSLLISPTVLRRDDLRAFKKAGADRIGVAIDCATEGLFEEMRGKAVGGPHRWGTYWRVYEESLDIFGHGKSGVHLICGLGESEKELIFSIDRAHKLGGFTHLFSFFPEKGSRMESVSPPPISVYRRIQMARWLIDNDKSEYSRMNFDSSDRVIDFGVRDQDLQDAIESGIPFETSGCPGFDGRTACNRPYGNEKPGEDIRNFPFRLEAPDVEKVGRELKEYC